MMMLASSDDDDDDDDDDGNGDGTGKGDLSHFGPPKVQRCWQPHRKTATGLRACIFIIRDEDEASKASWEPAGGMHAGQQQAFGEGQPLRPPTGAWAAWEHVARQIPSSSRNASKLQTNDGALIAEYA